MRDTSAAERLATIRQDARFAIRQLRRSPGFAVITGLTLALGIGASTAIFSVVRGVLLRPLPYPAADQIVQIWEVNREGGQMQMTDPNFDDLKARTRSFAAVVEFAGPGTVSVAGDVTPVRASTAIVGREFFDIMGIRPTLGRTFTAEEAQVGGPPVAVVSYGFWQRALDGSQNVIGRRLRTGDDTYTIVGVMSPALDFPVGTDIWVARERQIHFTSRTAHNWHAIGRLRGGTSVAAAQREVSGIARSLAAQYGSATLTADMRLVPLREELVATARPTLLVLLAASAVLLIIACTNVANLLVARLTTRRGELGLRIALGASASRIVQQSLIESVVLAAIGGILGVALASLGTHALLAVDPTRLPRAGEVRVDLVVLLFAMAVVLATAGVLAALTSWRVTRQDVRDSLAATDRTGAPTGAVGVRRALVTTQVAMTVVLLAAASLLGRSFIRLLSVDPGYRTKNTVVVDLSVEAGDSVAMVRRVQFYRELIARLHTIPGVTAVGAANNMPLSMPNAADGTFLEVSSPDVAFKLEDLERAFQDHSRTGDAEFRVVNDEYFRAMHIPVVQGRVFDDRDRPDAVNVAVISASLAQMRWPHDSPIGKWIEFGNMDGDMKPFMIVGIVGDVREAGLDALPRPTFYANYLQRPTTTRQMNVVLAGDGDPTVIAASARSILRDLRPDVPPRIRTLESMVKSSVASRRFALLLVGAFGTAALLLSAFGLYGVIAYFVAQRTTEIRIRIALGARRGDIMALVVQEGAVLTALGLVIGICVALAASRALASLLYGVSASDPVAFATTLVLVALAGALASTVPAYRASRADATGALRTG